MLTELRIHILPLKILNFTITLLLTEQKVGDQRVKFLGIF